jgi:hypothetical protein
MQWIQIRTDIVHEYDLSDVEIEVVDSLPYKGQMAAKDTQVEMRSAVFLCGC